MKNLTSEQIKIISSEINGYIFDIEKMIHYLDSVDVVSEKIFTDFFTGAEEYGQSYWGRKFVKEYANCRLSRDSFIKLIPLFFYYKEKDNGNMKISMDLIIPTPEYPQKLKQRQWVMSDIYKALEFMYYVIKLPIETIFTYSRIQLDLPLHRDNENFPLSSIRIHMGKSLMDDSKSPFMPLDAYEIFLKWHDYLTGCNALDTDDYTPRCLLTAYNEQLVKMGFEPILYKPISGPIRKGNMYWCKGHFPTDENGNVITEWTTLEIKVPKSMTFYGSKSSCDELEIELAPETSIRERSRTYDEYGNPLKDFFYVNIYAGPLIMEFDNEALKNYRLYREYTQEELAAAVGTTKRTYIKWESGEGKPYGDHLMRLINWLNIESVQHLTKYNYDIQNGVEYINGERYVNGVKSK